MFRKSIQIPVWALAAAALVVLSAGAFAGAAARTDEFFPALRLALPSGTGSFGVNFAPIPDATAAALGLDSNQGVVVTGLQCGQLQVGDIVTAISGEIVTSTNFLVNRAQAVTPGTPLDLTLIRNGGFRTIQVSIPTVLGLSTEPILTPSPLQIPYPAPPYPAPVVPNAPVFTQPAPPYPAPVVPNAPVFTQPAPEVVGVIQGVQVSTLSPNGMMQLGLSPATLGVIVTEVDSQTPAMMAGLRTNDVILEVNSTVVPSLYDYEKVIGSIGPNSVTLKVSRGGAILYIMIPAAPQ
jgi:S1-C subfamily serine protease